MRKALNLCEQALSPAPCTGQWEESLRYRGHRAWVQSLAWGRAQRFCQSLLLQAWTPLILPLGREPRGPSPAAPEPSKAAAASSWQGRRGPAETWTALSCRHGWWPWLGSSPMTLRRAAVTPRWPLLVHGQHSLQEEQGGLGTWQDSKPSLCPGCPSLPGAPPGVPLASTKLLFSPRHSPMGRPPGKLTSSTISSGSFNLKALGFLICKLGLIVPTVRNEMFLKLPGTKRS